MKQEARSEVAVFVYAYRGMLLIEKGNKKVGDDILSTSKNNEGYTEQTVSNTSANLGISAEAYNILKTLAKGAHVKGDLNWTQNSVGIFSFSWLGSMPLVIEPIECVVSNDWVLDPYVLVENAPSYGLTNVIDEVLSDRDATYGYRR